jgi:hypothetical protein
VPKPEPQWRKEWALPESLLRQSSVKMPTPPIPSYVQRWLIVTAHSRLGRGDGPEFAARILTEACNGFYRLHAPPPLFKLVRGFPVQPVRPSEDKEHMLALTRMTEGDPVRPCVFNGVYVWFFSLAKDQDAEGFRQWVGAEWPINAAALRKAGWPVLRLQRGDWPIDPRLLPGSPVALPQLEEETPANNF